MSDPNRTVKLGDRVCYRDVGAQDKGIITNITLEDFAFTVKWNRSNNVEEALDQFKGSQLEWVEDEEEPTQQLRPPHPLDLAYWMLTNPPTFDRLAFMEDTLKYVTSNSPFQSQG